MVKSAQLTAVLSLHTQLVISDVHIRYEDAAAEKSTVFAFGITIAKLAAQSTNEKWVGKQLDVNLRLYW